MFRIGTKGRQHSEETKQKMRDAYQKRVEAEKALKTRSAKPTQDIRADLADYLGLNPKKVSEAPQEAPDATKGENTKVCV